MQMVKRRRDLMPKFLKNNHEPPEKLDEFNQKLNILPDGNVISDEEVNPGTKRSQPNLMSDAEEIRSDVGTHLPPWTHSCRLPPLHPNTPRGPPKKRSRRCFNTSTMLATSTSTVDGASDTKNGQPEITKLCVINKHALEYTQFQGPSSSNYAVDGASDTYLMNKYTLEYIQVQGPSTTNSLVDGASDTKGRQPEIMKLDVMNYYPLDYTQFQGPITSNYAVDGASDTKSRQPEIMKLDVMNYYPLEYTQFQGPSTSNYAVDGASDTYLMNKYTLEYTQVQGPSTSSYAVDGASDTKSGQPEVKKQDVMKYYPWGYTQVQGPSTSNYAVDGASDTYVMNKYTLEYTQVQGPSTSNSPVDGASDTKSGQSEIKKLDVMNYCPLENTQVQSPSTSEEVNLAQPTKVYSFDEMKIQTEEKKCEVNPDSVQKRKKRDVSLLEHFTEEEINVHLMSLKKECGENGTRESDEEEEVCQLCGDGKVFFPPQPIYCSFCNRGITDNFYIPEVELSDVKHRMCSPCYNRSRSKITILGTTISKGDMLKKNKFDDEIPEEWVQCECCDKWQHQICGLYNKDKDVNETAVYFCPKCLLKERKSSKSINNMGLEDNTNLGAKDLPETILSHFIEQRLFKRLKEERNQTAEAAGKNINDVPEVEDLTLRVVFSDDKTSTVNKQFLDLLHKENYPSEFLYKSKVILLFQKVEGVDVLIFALFAEEFGSECSKPNQRSTYIGYLDSVKYFRPERKTFSGEALRTFVYHEILIGYLEYCKLRGFTTGYIWVCPPPKGEDYIMYSHPKTQQTPNTKKLREWYVTLLQKAVEQKVVTNVTNLYDRYFKTESTSRIMPVARLPYFEGSFWSTNTELLIQEIGEKSDVELKKEVNAYSKRKLKRMGYGNTSFIKAEDAKNILLMEQLEKSVYEKKEDLMVVDLNYSCTRCSNPILSGLRWFCDKCKNLQLCESCYNTEQELPGEHIHTKNDIEKHQLSKVQVKNIPATTEDDDLPQKNNIFESRHKFLSFSLEHNYNFDMLRRAKHSSMMILHNLHTSIKQRPYKLFIPLRCSTCKKDVAETIFFPCLICPFYPCCTGCRSKNTIYHNLHIFSALPSANGKTPRTVAVVELLNALQHAHLCRLEDTNSCSYQKCIEVKKLFAHNAQCGKKASCKICSYLKSILYVHAYHCESLDCVVRDCRDMKNQFSKKGIKM